MPVKLIRLQLRPRNWNEGGLFPSQDHRICCKYVKRKYPKHRTEKRRKRYVGLLHSDRQECSRKTLRFIGPSFASIHGSRSRTGESRRSAETFLDGSTVAALASLVVSAAQLAWTVCQDLRKKGSEPRQDVVVRRIRIQLDTPAALSTEDRQNVDRLIEVVVGETLKHGGG